MVLGEGDSRLGVAKVDLVGVALCGGEETAMVLVCSGLGTALRTDLNSHGLLSSDSR